MTKEKKIMTTGFLLFSEAYKRAMNYFFSFPSSAVGLNDLSEVIGVSKTSLKNAVLQLEKEGFLKKEEIGRAWRITMNQGHLFLLTRKVPIALQTVYESGIVNMITEKFPSAKAIVLFGTFRNGADNEQSDLDIAVETSGNEEPRIEQLGELENFAGYRKKIPINLFIFSRNKVDINVFNNIANGIILSGFLEVRA